MRKYILSIYSFLIVLFTAIVLLIGCDGGGSNSGGSNNNNSDPCYPSQTVGTISLYTSASERNTICNNMAVKYGCSNYRVAGPKNNLYYCCGSYCD